jgi:hypothetical protein
MADALLLSLAFVCSFAGMAALALALKPHWDEARAPHPYPMSGVRALRGFGAVALALSLALCLVAEHPSLASLIWMMASTISALIVAFVLAYRPRWIGWVAAWLR